MITGRVLRTEEDTQRGAIRIIVEFSDDGNVIVPEWVLWAQWKNFIGRTTEEVVGWIRVCIEDQIGRLIMAKNRSALNAEFMAAIESIKSEAIYSKDDVVIPVEATLTIAEPYTVTLKSDGTYTTDRVK